MKKLFVCFAVFAVMFFMVGCGGGSKTGDTSDTGDTVTDDDVDSGDSGSADTDPSDSGHENPDTAPDAGDSVPDNGDSTPDNDADSGDTVPDSENEEPVNENPDNLPECSATSATPCIDSEAVNSDSEKTYLIWSGKSPERLRWVDAVEYCSNLNEGSFNDWQLPTIAALKTLLWSGTYCELGSYCSKFGDIAFFWSATQGVGVDFYTGSSPYKSDAETFDVRCVRKEITTPREKECPELEFENTLYNSVSSITQTWQWSCVCWSPTNEIAYSIVPSTTTCRFTCKAGCNWYQSQCIDPTVECGPESSTPCTDPLTGFIWSSKVESCSGLTEGGFEDWRDPNLSELRTLIRNCPNTVIGGSCNLTTSCAYRNDACDGCTYNDNGKYSLFGDTGIFGSSTVQDHYAAHYSYINFDYATIHTYKSGGSPNKQKRCIRSSICDQNYFWNGNECETAPQKTVNCVGLPENAEWNSTDKIIQTWNGHQWLPIATGVYDTTTSSSECHFKCVSGYSWNGSQCKKIPECDLTTSSALCIDAESGLIWSKKSENRKYFVNIDCGYGMDEGGFTDWKTPSISKLRTLIQNCSATKTGGSCRVTDSCWYKSDCYNSSSCNGCSEDSSGIYSKLGDNSCLWSGTSDSNSFNYYYVCFGTASINDGGYSNGASGNMFYYRCVRNAE